jgi:PAS domain S-box-containing protein
MDYIDSLFDMLENSADGAFVIDEAQRIIFWSKAAQKILGYTSDEVLGQTCYNILRGCDETGHIICHHDCHVMATFRNGNRVSNYDVATRTKSGEMRWINVSILNFVPGPDAVTPVVVHLFRDATQTKQNEQFIHQMFDAVERWQQTTTPNAQEESDGSRVEALTKREREVLSLLAQGHGTADIAESLSISAATVRNHVQSILHKLQVHSRVEAIAYAFDHGLVTNGKEI